MNWYHVVSIAIQLIMLVCVLSIMRRAKKVLELEATMKAEALKALREKAKESCRDRIHD